MDADRWQRVERVLDRALASTRNNWPAVLDEACGDDIALRHDVESLLSRLPRAFEFLRSPPSAAAAALVEEAAEERNRDGSQ